MLRTLITKTYRMNDRMVWLETDTGASYKLLELRDNEDPRHEGGYELIRYERGIIPYRLSWCLGFVEAQRKMWEWASLYLTLESDTRKD